MIAYPYILKLRSKLVTAQNAVLQFRQATTSASENTKFAFAKKGRHNWVFNVDSIGRGREGSRQWSMRKILYLFVVLQSADLLTTVLALKLGGVEENAVVQAFMSVGPYAGLILSKLVVLSLALGFALWSKQATLRRANVVFAAIVAWNLTVIVRLLL